MQSTHEMIREADADFKKADAEMNAIYKKLHAQMDKTGQAKLKAAQVAWLKFRDTNAEVDADIMRGGTGATPIRIASRASATKARTADLKEQSEARTPSP